MKDRRYTTKNPKNPKYSEVVAKIDDFTAGFDKSAQQIREAGYNISREDVTIVG